MAEACGSRSYEQNAPALACVDGREVDGGRGLADASLVVGYGNSMHGMRSFQHVWVRVRAGKCGRAGALHPYWVVAMRRGVSHCTNSIPQKQHVCVLFLKMLKSVTLMSIVKSIVISLYFWHGKDTRHIRRGR